MVRAVGVLIAKLACAATAADSVFVWVVLTWKSHVWLQTNGVHGHTPVV